MEGDEPTELPAGNSPANEPTFGAALKLQTEFEPIDVYIMSVGGHMHACLAAVDEMVAMQQLSQTIKGSDGTLHTVWARQIRTHCFGYCASAGAMLLLAGRHRRVGPNDRVLMHQPSAGASGGLDEMHRQLQNIESLTATAYEIILKRCNVSEYAYWTDTSKSHLVFVKNCYCTGDMWHNQLRVVSVEGKKDVAYTREWLESLFSTEKKKEFDTKVAEAGIKDGAEAAAAEVQKREPDPCEAEALTYKVLDYLERASIVEGFEPGTGKKQRLRPVLVKVTGPSSEYEIVNAPEPGQQVVHFRRADEGLQDKWVKIIASARGSLNPTMDTFDDAFKQLMESDLYLGARECSDMGVSTEGSDETFTPHWRSIKTIV
jgi:ATP-dependent protease ClpP protease subunit